MEQEERKFINENIDVELLIKYIKSNNLMNEVMNNTCIRYIATEEVFIIEDSNDCEIEYTCNVECSYMNIKVCTLKDTYTEYKVTKVKNSGKILCEKTMELTSMAESMIKNSSIARKEIIKNLNITEEKFDNFLIKDKLNAIKAKILAKDNQINELYEKQKEIIKCIEELEIEKKKYIKELRDTQEYYSKVKK